MPNYKERGENIQKLFIKMDIFIMKSNIFGFGKIFISIFSECIFIHKFLFRTFLILMYFF